MKNSETKFDGNKVESYNIFEIFFTFFIPFFAFGLQYKVLFNYEARSDQFFIRIEQILNW